MAIPRWEVAKRIQIMSDIPVFETLAVTLSDHVATVRVNRPDNATAINTAT